MIELSLCIMSLTVALPMAVALYEQRATLSREQMEPEFQKIPIPSTNKDEPVKYV